MRPSLVLALVAAIGCKASPQKPTGDRDLSAPDLGAGDDVDMGSSGGDVDMANGPARDLEPPPGLQWPSTQVFPSFGPIGPLDVIDIGGLPSDQRTLVTTLEGLVNRAKPRIYALDGGGEGKTFWLDKLGASSTSNVGDALALVDKYKSEVKGIVISDDALVDTINLATVIAAQKDGIVASPALAPTLMAAPYSLPLIADLRSNHFAAKLDVYNYELANWSANATHRLIVGLNPSVAANLRDYAVATKAMMVWLDPRVAAEQSLLAQFLALLPANSPYLGWWADEPTGVHAASTAGVPTYAADWSSNLTALGGTPRGRAMTPPAPAPPPLENKVYVAIFMSDGDNVQEDQHLIPIKWADAKRGQVPIGWTVDPALVDVAPVILRYYQSTATHDDVLVSGPSGLGYTYPAAWPANVFDSYAQVSARYLAAAGLEAITVWNNGVDLSTANAHSYAANMPGVLGLTIQNESVAQQFLDNTLPLVRLAVSYGGNEAALEAGIDPQLASWTAAAPLFIAVQGDMNQSTIQPTTFYNVQQHYATNSNVVFVRADHFFRLMRQWHAPPAHRVFAGDFNGDGKSDALFYFAGDGNWWMGVSDGNALAFHLAGNSGAANNWLDGKHAFFTGDFNGDGKSDVLVYASADGSWRFGLSDGTSINWSVASTTPGYGDLLDGTRKIFTGDFNGDGKTDVLFHYKGDGKWWLGTSNGSALAWSNVATTTGFGNLLDGGHALFVGDYNGDGKSDVMFYYAGDGNWWMGLSDGATLTFHQAGASTSGFGNLLDRSRRILQGDFNGDGKSDFVFYNASDGNWWMGTSDGTNLNWHKSGNVAPPENVADCAHRTFVGDFDGNGKRDVAWYDSDDGSWWVGLSDGTNLTFHQAAVAPALGTLSDYAHLLFGGDFDGDGKSDFLGYDGASGNWNLALSDGNALKWHLAVNSSGFGDLTR